MAKILADHIMVLEMFIDDVANVKLADENETFDTAEAFQAFKAMELEIVHLRKVLMEAREALNTLETPGGLCGLYTIRQGRPIKYLIDEMLEAQS